MIIACPACATRYAVPDSAIGLEGRVVRCAKCRHSWFQEGPDPATLAPAPEAPSLEAPSEVPPAPPRPAEPVSAPPAPTPPPAPVMAAPAPAPPSAGEDMARAWLHTPPASSFDALAEDDDTPSRFAHEPPFRPRRNPARLWTIAALIFAVVAFGAIGAVAKFGLPDWAPLAHTSFASGPGDLVLDFPAERQDRRTLPNGTEYFGVSGKITNVGKERRVVPTLLIVLRDSANHIVYSWEVNPPKRVLAPGETTPVIEAVTDIPRTAKFAEIGWKRS